MNKTRMTDEERRTYEAEHPLSTKVCAHCKQERAIRFFGVNRTRGKSSDGYQSWCMICSREYSRAKSRRKEQNEVLPFSKTIQEATLEDLMPRLKELGVTSVSVEVKRSETINL